MQSAILERAVSRRHLFAILPPAPPEPLSHAFSIHHGQRSARPIRLFPDRMWSDSPARLGKRCQESIVLLYRGCELHDRSGRKLDISRLGPGGSELPPWTSPV